jgi:hypothetical protein
MEAVSERPQTGVGCRGGRTENRFRHRQAEHRFRLRFA